MLIELSPRSMGKSDTCNGQIQNVRNRIMTSRTTASPRTSVSSKSHCLMHSALQDEPTVRLEIDVRFPESDTDSQHNESSSEKKFTPISIDFDAEELAHICCKRCVPCSWQCLLFSTLLNKHYARSELKPHNLSFKR